MAAEHRANPKMVSFSNLSGKCVLGTFGGFHEVTESYRCI